MSSKGGHVARLIEKEKTRKARRNGNTFKPLLSRNHSTFAEKQVALRAYQLLLAPDDLRGKIPVVIAPIFDGSGVPNEGYDFGDGPIAKTYKQSKVTGKVTFVVPVAPTVARWSRRNGFAAR